jgi:GNAT superfamily N-acetyltransferase
MHEAANGERQALDGITFRRPTEADYTSIVRVIDDWWGGRDMQWLLPRLWLQHFSSTSWLAESEDGRLAGFLVGFLSQDRADIAYCRVIATNPNLRGQGLARQLYTSTSSRTRWRPLGPR